MKALYLMAWDATNEVWRRVSVNSDGKLVITGTTYTDADARAAIGNIFDSSGLLQSTLYANYKYIRNVARLFLKADLSDSSSIYFFKRIGSGSMRVIASDSVLGNIPSKIQTYNGSAYHNLTADDHDHTGGNGAQIDHTTLSNIGTNTHAQIDAFISKFNSGCHVTVDSTQTVSDSTLTIIEFTVVDWDLNSEYDETTNYRFTAKQAGYYQVNAAVDFIAAAWAQDDGMQLYLYKNGSFYSELFGRFIEANCTQYKKMKGSDMLYLDVDDYFDIRVLQTRGSDTNISAARGYTYMSCHLLS